MIRFAKKIAKFPEPVQRAVLRQLADERRGQVPLPLRPSHRAQRRGAVALRRQLRPGPRGPVFLSASRFGEAPDFERALRFPPNDHAAYECFLKELVGCVIIPVSLNV